MTASRFAVVVIVTAALALSSVRTHSADSRLLFTIGGKTIGPGDHVLEMGSIPALRGSDEKSEAEYQAHNEAVAGWLKAATPAGAICSTAPLSTDVASPRAFEVTVRNDDDVSIRLTAIYFGSKTIATWKQSPDARVDETTNSAVIPSKGAVILSVSFDSGRSVIQDLNEVVFTANSERIATFTIDYELRQAYVDVEYSSGDVPSGAQDSFSGATKIPYYSISTGTAPPGYTLLKACGWLTGDRVCNVYSTCEWENGAPSDSVAKLNFNLQGHKGESSGRLSAGHIRAAYGLMTKAPTLVR